MGAVSSQLEKLPTCYLGEEDADSQVNNSTTPPDHNNTLPSLDLQSIEKRRSSNQDPQTTGLQHNHNSQPLDHHDLNNHAGIFGVSTALQHLPGRSIAKLQTLRKKMSKLRRRVNNYSDYRKQFREFLSSSWSYKQLINLLQEYEALAIMKQLEIESQLARPTPPYLKTDLTQLFEQSWSSDLQITYQDATFKVHRAILSIRCPYFRTRLRQKCPTTSADGVTSSNQNVVIDPIPGVDVRVFTCLLRYLYTGALQLSEAGLEDNWDILSILCQKFGLPNQLEQDMKLLLPGVVWDSTTVANSCTNSADCVLVFAPIATTTPASSTLHSPPIPEPPFSPNSAFYLPCHTAILACRSKLLRSLIERRRQDHNQLVLDSGCACGRSSLLSIVLDEDIIPRRLAVPLLHWLYTDRLDPGLLSGVQRKLSQKPASTTYLEGLCNSSLPSQIESFSCGYLNDLMQLYQIGEFLDCLALSQCCEDLLVSCLSVDNLVEILRWSEQPHGSPFLHRQACHFLRENFLTVAHSPALFALTREELVHTLSSNYTQAPESEVLSSIIRWGEHTLMKIIEEREPNVVSQTAHSVTRKGVRRRDLNDSELTEVISSLTPLVRTRHVLPSSRDILSGAVKRGLITSPGQFESPAMSWCRPTTQQSSANANPGGCGGLLAAEESNSVDTSCSFFTPASLQPPSSSSSARRGFDLALSTWEALYQPPRLFTPFSDEVRSLVTEHPKGNPKSWLAMVDNEDCKELSIRSHQQQQLLSTSSLKTASFGGKPAPLDVLPFSLNGVGFVGDEDDDTSDVAREAAAVSLSLDRILITSVWERTRKLQQSPLVQGALLSLPFLDRTAVLGLLQLRTLREAGIPDSLLGPVFSGWQQQQDAPPPTTPPATIPSSSTTIFPTQPSTRSSKRHHHHHHHSRHHNRHQHHCGRPNRGLYPAPSIDPPPPPTHNLLMTSSAPDPASMGLQSRPVEGRLPSSTSQFLHLPKRSFTTTIASTSGLVSYPPPNLPAPPPPTPQPGNNSHHHRTGINHRPIFGASRRAQTLLRSSTNQELVSNHGAFFDLNPHWYPSGASNNPPDVTVSVSEHPQQQSQNSAQPTNSRSNTRRPCHRRDDAMFI